MTPTEQDNELFELCEKCYEATGWDDDNLEHKYSHDGTYPGDGEREHPLYTSDYLLEKLQSWFYDMGANDFGQFGVAILADGCIAKVRSHDKEFSEQASADTLLLALLKLTLKLHEEKIL